MWLLADRCSVFAPCREPHLVRDEGGAGSNPAAPTNQHRLSFLLGQAFAAFGECFAYSEQMIRMMMAMSLRMRQKWSQVRLHQLSLYTTSYIEQRHDDLSGEMKSFPLGQKPQVRRCH